MKIFEITFSGTFLNIENHERNLEIQSLITHLESQFFEANLALNCFEEEIKVPGYRLDWNAQQNYWLRIQEICTEIEREGGFQLNTAGQEAIRYEAELRLKREKWAQGIAPRDLSERRKFIYAKAFLYALDGFDRFFEVLAKTDGAPPAVAEHYKEIDACFPDLRGVRNSSHHLEDRARLLKTGGKKIDLKPLNNDLAKSQGNLMILNGLNGSRYGSTMADGYYGEVDVSGESMDKLQRIFQAAIDALPWKGPKRHSPQG